MQRALTTIEINAKLRNVEGFLGTYASDEIPPKPDLKTFSIVVNVDSSRKPGSHWIALVYKTNTFYFIDSYGRRITNILFADEFKTTISNYIDGVSCKFVNKQLQQFTSNVCGEYCIYFIRQIYKTTFNKILKEFSAHDLEANDNLVLKYSKEL